MDNETLTLPPGATSDDFLVVVSGVTCGGKTHSIKKLLPIVCALERFITTTTRPPRPNGPQKKMEINGVDYHFIDDAEFQRRIAGDGFIEHVMDPLGRRYGTERHILHEINRRGKMPIININYQGAQSFLKLYPNVLPFFVEPNQLSELEPRLRKRNPNMPEPEIQKRLELAGEEMLQSRKMPYIIISAGPGQIDFIVETMKPRILRHIDESRRILHKA